MKNDTDISKFTVVQSNNLVEAHYSTELTAHAHKVARLMLSFIKPDDTDMRTYTIPIAALKQYLGIKPNSRQGAFYDRLKETSKKLNKQPIEIRHKNGDIIVASFLSGYKISPKEGNVTFEISSLLKPFLLDLRSNYTSYLLGNIPKLKSGYSIRIYELLYQYKRIGKRTFELTDLQKKVGSNYALYGDFKRKVLKQAQKDLKIYTDLTFIFAEIKTGRKITSIEFVIFGNIPKNDNTPQLNLLEEALELRKEVEPPALSEVIITELNKLGINEQNVSKYLAKGFEIIMDEEKRAIAKQRCTNLNNYYLEKLELTKHSNTNNNSAGFLIKALKEDWISNKAVAKVKNTKLAEKKKEKKLQIISLEKQDTKLKKQYEELNNAALKPLINNEVELNLAFESIKSMFGFTQFFKPSSSLIKNYNQNNFIASAIDAFFRTKYPEKFKASKAIFNKRTPIKKEIEKLKAEF